MKLSDKSKEIIIIALMLIIQTVIFAIAGVNKSYLHMDEAYSLGLANYNKTEIQANNDFYDKWHNKEYYEDYLTVNQNEKDNFEQVYENQKNDVHPPLYYLLLRIAMGFHLDSYSKWPGIILNIIIYLFITIFMYLIIKEFLIEKNKSIEKSAILALVSSITLAAVTNAIYIRMYALSTLNIVITTYLHLKLLNTKEANFKLLIQIGICALIGSLTHYYYLFYLAALFTLFVVEYIKEKKYKELSMYIGIIATAGIVSLIIFPYSIQHMFFGYRGQGVISKLINIPESINGILQYVLKLNLYDFNNTLFIILIIIIGLIIYKKVNKIKLIDEKNKYVKYIIVPSFVYFILVAVSAPWIELRYIMPVCGLIFVIIIYTIINLLNNVFNKKITTCIMGVVFLLMFIMPILSNHVLKAIPNIYYKIEPEVLYSDKREIVNTLKNELNLPTLYVFNSNNNRFLDDILLFANINESFIAKDMECNEENIREILKDKNVDNGIIVFINEGQENENILEIIKDTIELHNITWLKRLNACDVYLVK